jgi:formate dehydrogenase major subunit
MTLHFPDEVPTNLLTIDVSDPKSGTAEFKACAVRVVRVIPSTQVTPPLIGSARDTN